MSRRAREAYVEAMVDWALSDPPLSRTDIERCIRDIEIRVEHATSELLPPEPRGLWETAAGLLLGRRIRKASRRSWVDVIRQVGLD